MMFYYLKSCIGFRVTHAVDPVALSQSYCNIIDMTRQSLLNAATAGAQTIFEQQHWTRYVVILRGDIITKDNTTPDGLRRAELARTPITYELHGAVYKGLPDWPVVEMPPALHAQYHHHRIASLCGKFGDGIASKDEILFWPHTRTLPTM